MQVKTRESKKKKKTQSKSFSLLTWSGEEERVKLDNRLLRCAAGCMSDTLTDIVQTISFDHRSNH